MKFKQEAISLKLDKNLSEQKIEADINLLYDRTVMTINIMDKFHHEIVVPFFESMNKQAIDKDYVLNFYLNHHNHSSYILCYDELSNPSMFNFDLLFWKKAVSFFQENKIEAVGILNENDSHLFFSYIPKTKRNYLFNDNSAIISEFNCLFDNKCQTFLEFNLKKYMKEIKFPNKLSLRLNKINHSYYLEISYFCKLYFKIPYQKVNTKEELLELIFEMKNKIEYRFCRSQVFRKLNNRVV